MSEVLTKVVVDCSTGVQEIIPLTAEEITQLEADAAAYAVEKTAQEESAAALAALKESAKAKLIAGNPLSAEEAAVLVI